MSDNYCEPKTRQEKKNKRGSKEKVIYNQKHIRLREAMITGSSSKVLSIGKNSNSKINS
jgi:hypothetical protein